MKTVDYKDLKHYIGCNLSNTFFYCINSNEISCVDDIVSSLSVNEVDFRENCFYYEYIPLPTFDLSDELNKFIDSLHNKKVSRYFDEIDKKDETDYWVAFDKAFPDGFERRLWSECYDELIEHKASDWCNEYGIRYR